MNIQIVKLQFCHDNTCSLEKKWHLKVEYEYVELSKSSAIAISYTWGEFDRRDVVIGHDAQGSAVSMNLGREWDVEELIVRLATICLDNGEEHGSEHAACWIDQLCLSQKSEDQIRIALARIPSIYRTLDVVALMPGAVCKCARKTADWIFDPNWEHHQSAMGCINVVGFCSYFDRVWTRQELYYSRCIRIMRTSNEEIPCVRSVADAHSLSSFANCLFTRFLSEGYPREEAFSRIEPRKELFLIDALEAVKEYTEGPSHYSSYGDRYEFKERFAEFLSGQKITNPKREIQQDKGTILREFLHQLSVLGLSNRRATKARDYVTSVWVDCPGYILPKDFKAMCLPSLLDDAVRQLEVNHGVSLLVTSGAGLFGDSLSGSILWRPVKYLGRRKILGTKQIYDVIARGQRPIPVTTNHEVPLRILPLPSIALSRRSREYANVFSNRDAAYVFNALKPVVKGWTDSISLRVGITLAKIALLRQIPYLTDSRSLDFAAFLGQFAHNGNFVILDHWSGPKEIDHYEAVYLLVTVALGLDFQECRSHNLGLMVSLDDPPYIGLMKMKSRDGRMDLRARAQQDVEAAVTICTDVPKTGDPLKKYGDFLLEAIKKEDSPTPRYHLAGIWVPRGYRSSFRPGAIIEAGSCDGLLGWPLKSLKVAREGNLADKVVELP